MSYLHAITTTKVAGSDRWFAPGCGAHQPREQEEQGKPGAQVFRGVDLRNSVEKRNFIFIGSTMGKPMRVIYQAQHHPWDHVLAFDHENSFMAQYQITFLLDEAFNKGEFAQVDAALASLDVDRASPALLISILSSTIPAKAVLNNRASLFDRVQQSLERRGKLEPGLLDGLQ